MEDMNATTVHILHENVPYVLRIEDMNGRIVHILNLTCINSKMANQRKHGSPNSSLVARTGFEPVISALRGRRPEPLDERAKSDKTQHTMAGMEGVEPPLTEPESAVLPLDDIPK